MENKKHKNHNKSPYVYIQVDLVPASSMEQLKYTKYLKIATPIRPLVSNIGTAKNDLAKYLAKLLFPLHQTEYTIKNTKQFIEQIRMKQVPDGYKMVSFDIKSLFSNVTLGKTIEITLERIYERKEINSSISKKEMKQLLTMCTKNVHFSYDNTVYQQNDGVSMGSPLRAVLSVIFMVELENSLV